MHHRCLVYFLLCLQSNLNELFHVDTAEDVEENDAVEDITSEELEKVIYSVLFHY